jgi:hypothetical protein
MPHSDDYDMELNVAYNMESTCPIKLILGKYHLHEQAICDNNSDNSCSTIFSCPPFK